MSELATETAIARYGLKQRFQALSDCVKKKDNKLFLSARDAYFEYVQNDGIFKKILGEDLQSGLIPSEELPFEEWLDIGSGTIDEMKKDFEAIHQVHDILIKGLDEALSFAGFYEEKIKKEEIPDKIVNDENMKEIKDIIVVTKTQQADPLMVINKDYNEAVTIVGSTSKNIKAMIEAIEDGTDVLKCDDLVQCRDYLNSNASCKLYRGKDGKKQIYKLTEIVRFDDPYKHDRKLEISKKVTTRKMTSQDYKRNLSKQKNRIGT
ncbi:MAG: hypothetical protein WC819_04135 [Parcubacteria group bacterium]|jgi:hypothetical protein